MMISNDIVMGLHWTPPAQRRDAGLEAANLDAVCVLLDREGRRLEVIRPGHLKSANGSVVHTGDSRTGASAWDDERIFVFIDALPGYVDSLVLGVVSHDRPFSEVAGASCHISDVRLENELLRIQLTSLGPVTEYCIATVQRRAFGWIMRQRAPGGVSLAEVLSLPPSRNVEASYRSEATASACAAARPGLGNEAATLRSHEHAASCEELITRMEGERRQSAHALYDPADEAT